MQHHKQVNNFVFMAHCYELKYARFVIFLFANQTIKEFKARPRTHLKIDLIPTMSCEHFLFWL